MHSRHPFQKHPMYKLLKNINTDTKTSKSDLHPFLMSFLKKKCKKFARNSTALGEGLTICKVNSAANPLVTCGVSGTWR